MEVNLIQIIQYYSEIYNKVNKVKVTCKLLLSPVLRWLLGFYWAVSGVIRY